MACLIQKVYKLLTTSVKVFGGAQIKKCARGIMKKTEEKDSTIQSVKSRTRKNIKTINADTGKTKSDTYKSVEKSDDNHNKVVYGSVGNPVEKISGHDKIALVAVFVIILVVLFNQFQIQSVYANIGGKSFFPGSLVFSGGKDLKNLQLPPAQSTGHTVALVMDVGKITDAQSAIEVMVPTGSPEYGDAIGVTFDDPLVSLDKLAKAYPALNAQIKEKPELWSRFINLASNNYGVSCEFCCGVGPAGVTKDGKAKCGCQHLPALLSVTQWLMLNTDYSDAEILREVMRWKTLFFPKDMVNLAVQVAGGDTSSLEAMPAMVGGC